MRGSAPIDYSAAKVDEEVIAQDVSEMDVDDRTIGEAGDLDGVAKPLQSHDRAPEESRPPPAERAHTSHAPSAREEQDLDYGSDTQSYHSDDEEVSYNLESNICYLNAHLFYG